MCALYQDMALYQMKKMENSANKKVINVEPLVEPDVINYIKQQMSKKVTNRLVK